MPCRGGPASVSAGVDWLAVEVRPAAVRLVERRTDGRADFGAADRGLDAVDLGLAVVDFGLAAVLALAVASGFAVVALAADVTVARFAVVRLAAVDLVELAFVLLADAFGLAAVPALALPAVLDFAVLREVEDRFGAALAAGLAVDIVLAAAVSAFAAADIDLVAVFIERIADDIVLADEFALVAAAVILLAADVTLVAADETVRAAAAGVAPLLVERDAVRPAAVLRVDREAGLRAVDDVDIADFVAVLRVAFGLARLTVDLGRRAVPDALRLTDLLRAVLAELRRVAALVFL